MTPTDLIQHRLHNLRLTGRSFTTPTAPVDHLVAVQSQEYADAKWALAQRLAEPTTDQAVEAAFNAGDILRTHLLRPTWHFVRPADIRWLLLLTAPRVHALNATYYRRLGLDDDTLRRAHSVLEKALQNHHYRTRTELRAALEQNGIPGGDTQRLAYIIMHAELERLVCSGPRRGKQFTYALLEERVPPAKPLTPEEALVELTGRFFHTRGPANEYDLAKWASLTITQAREGLEAVRHELEAVEVEGQTYWIPAGSAPPPAAPDPQLFLLSVFDEYISSYKNHGDLMNAEDAARLMEAGRNVILSNGRVVGMWWRKLLKKTVEIRVERFRPFTNDEQQALQEAAGRYGAFLGLEPVLDEGG